MTHDPSRRALSFDSRLDGRRDSTHCHTSRLDGGLDGRQDGCQKISPVVCQGLKRHSHVTVQGLQITVRHELQHRELELSE